jgi:cytochrome P450
MRIQKVTFLLSYAHWQKITSLVTTFASICWLDREPFTYCIPRISSRCSPRTSQVKPFCTELDYGNILTVATDYGFGARPDIFAPLLGKGIFTQEGPAWKHSRKLLREQFSRVQYHKLTRFQEHVDNLLARLPVSGVVDLQPLFFSLTLDTTTALLFGRSVYSLRANLDQDTENRTFAESFNVAQEGLAMRFRIVPWHFFYNPPKFRRACANVHRYVEGYIKARGLHGGEAGPEEDSCSFIDQVAKDSENIAELRDQLLNVLLAGRDTTACCLSWTL